MTLHMSRRHLPFMVAAACGLVALLVFWQLGRTSHAIVGAACLFFVVYLVLTAVRIPKLDAQYLCEHAASTDEPAWIIFGLTFLTIVIALGFMFTVLNEAPASRDPLQVALALATVALGWFSIHTMAALHYAHLYWQPDDQPGNIGDPREGLLFPKDQEDIKPGALDFLYFSFVIGMTAQTSDVQITTTRMRKFNMVHSIVSFFFNTVLVAVAVNVAVAVTGMSGQ
jgi:uncharacterized membrane protein